MARDKVMSADDAVSAVLDGDALVTSGFVGIGFPEALAVALAERFDETGHPSGLTLVYAAGQGDGDSRGLNHFTRDGMVDRVIGGHWGLIPGISQLAMAGRVRGYNFPQGVISHLFRDIAAGKPGTLTDVGLRTFCDPRLGGGKVNDATTEDLVELVEVAGEELLFYRALPLDVAFIRGTTADVLGNVTMEREALTLETLSIAQAVRNSGGVVIAQVERVTTRRVQSPREVKVPGVLVDAVVVATPQRHWQTFDEQYNPAYTGEVLVDTSTVPPVALDPRKVIARRAARTLRHGAIVNLGIGMPEGVANVASEEGVLDDITLTVEAGGVGGLPAGGLSFGASANPQAIIDQPYQFDYYDGGGLDQAYLGFAQVDRRGNVNVSRFGPKLAGAGGFINISQNAHEVYFLGTFAARADVRVGDGGLSIPGPGEFRKFVDEVEQITFSGELALERGQRVRYITERCVLGLTDAGLELLEIAPGADVDRDVLQQMDFRPVVPDDVPLMDATLFGASAMGLTQLFPASIDARVIRGDDRLTVDLEGLHVRDEEDVAALADRIESQLSDAGGAELRVEVRHDDCVVAPAAQDALTKLLVRLHAHEVQHCVRDAFVRRRLRRQLMAAGADDPVVRARAR